MTDDGNHADWKPRVAITALAIAAALTVSVVVDHGWHWSLLFPAAVVAACGWGPPPVTLDDCQRPWVHGIPPRTCMVLRRSLDPPVGMWDALASPAAAQLSQRSLDEV